MNWTDERVELLRKLWSEGLSASQIAAQLGEELSSGLDVGMVGTVDEECAQSVYPLGPGSG